MSVRKGWLGTAKVSVSEGRQEGTNELYMKGKMKVGAIGVRVDMRSGSEGGIAGICERCD